MTGLLSKRNKKTISAAGVEIDPAFGFLKFNHFRSITDG